LKKYKLFSYSTHEEKAKTTFGSQSVQPIVSTCTLSNRQNGTSQRHMYYCVAGVVTLKQANIADCLYSTQISNTKVKSMFLRHADQKTPNINVNKTQ
jgi:hypothetical protein